MSHRRGMALLAVLVLIAVLAALVGTAVFTATVDLRLSENAEAFARAEAGLDAAEEGARFLLRRDYEQDAAREQYVDTRQEQWARPGAAFCQRLGGAAAAVAVEVSITDAESRLNINRIDRAYSGQLGVNAPAEAREEVCRLLGQLGHPNPKRVVGILRDWIDADATGEYEGEGPDRPLHSVYELNGVTTLADDPVWQTLLSEGVLYAFLTAQKLDIGTVRDCGRVNVNTAPLEVLSAVLDDPGLAQHIIAGRPHVSINPGLKEWVGIDAYRAAPRHRLTVASQVFRVEAVAKSDVATCRRVSVFERRNGEVRLRFRAPMDRTDSTEERDG